MSESNVKVLIILSLIMVVIIIWLMLTLRNIKIKKRISDYVINSSDTEDISLIGKVFKKYFKIRKSLVVILKKIFTKKIDNNYNEKLLYLADKLLLALTTLIIYLIISLINFKKPQFILMILSLLVGYLIPILRKKLLYIINRRQVEKDLLKAISLINSSLASGKSMIQSIKVISVELDGPIALEFEQIEKDLENGLSLRTAFDRFSKRVNLEEVNYIATSLIILNQTGGDIKFLFKTLEERFYTRRRLNNELNAITASSKLLFQILVFMPIFLFILISLFSPNYFATFFKSELGLIIFSLIILIYLLYVVLIKNIMKVEKY